MKKNFQRIVLHQVLNGRKNVGIVVKVKKSKVFRQEGFTFAIFRLLHFDYQQLTQGETPPKTHLVFIEGFTLLYYLIINPLYSQNHIGETPCSKSFSKKYLDHGKHGRNGSRTLRCLGLSRKLYTMARKFVPEN